MPILHGTQHWAAKLNDDEVREIRRRYAPGVVSLRALAEEYRVSFTTVQAIVDRRTWRHLEDAPAL